MYDVVYILKEDVAPDELKYSLRSVVENLEYRYVWFYCGQPQGLVPDRAVTTPQTGRNKWEKARSSLERICKNDEITEKFWLFNDDFFLLKPLTDETPLYGGMLHDHILHVEHRHEDKRTGYTQCLRFCEELLKSAGMTTYDYALHVPMLIDRKKMLETLEAFPVCPMFRSMYGNFAGIGGRQHGDVKIVNLDDGIKDDDFVSTGDGSFKFGRVGIEIRSRFRKKSKYEQAVRKTVL